MQSPCTDPSIPPTSAMASQLHESPSSHVEQYLYQSAVVAAIALFLIGLWSF